MQRKIYFDDIDTIKNHDKICIFLDENNNLFIGKRLDNLEIVGLYLDELDIVISDFSKKCRRALKAKSYLNETYRNEDKSRFKHLEHQDAPEWQGLKFSIRLRVSQACRHINKTGKLQKSDLMSLGEISQTVASQDIAKILERAPDLMQYDKSKHCYVLKEAVLKG